MLFVITTLLLFANAHGDEATASPLRSESDLRRELFANYDKLVRPVKDPRTTINATAGIAPLSIKELDDKEQVLVIDTFFQMSWQDDYLQWDPSLFSGIDALRVPHTEVWKPDFSVYTTSSEDGLFPRADTQVLIFPSGKVLWVPMFTIRSRCPIPNKDKTIVECSIKIGSWTYHGYILDIGLYSEKVDLQNFQNNNPNWKLVDVKSSRAVKYYPCCKEPYPNLFFNVTLKRRWNYSGLSTESYPTKIY